MDIYLSQETLWSVEATFPYMVNKEFASGGGDVSADHLRIDESRPRARTRERRS